MLPLKFPILRSCLPFGKFFHLTGGAFERQFILDPGFGNFNIQNRGQDV